MLYSRLERLDHLAMKFKHKCDIHEAWADGQDEYLKHDDITDAPLASLLVSCTCKHCRKGICSIMDSIISPC